MRKGLVVITGASAGSGKNREMQKTFLARLRHPQGIVNHLTMLSSESSEALVRSIPSLVKIPTTIISGSEDPIYPLDHGKGLARLIENSEYVLADGMGHIPNEHFYDLYISILKRQSSTCNNITTIRESLDPPQSEQQ